MMRALELVIVIAGVLGFLGLTQVSPSDPELRCLRRASIDLQIAAKAYGKQPTFASAIHYAESVVGLRQAERDRKTRDWRNATTELQALSAVHQAKRLAQTNSERTRVERLNEWLESYGPQLASAR